jgi:hypothetical protein
VGDNLVLTCRAVASTLELIRDLRWLDPAGQPLTEDGRLYSEELHDEVASVLFMKHVEEEDAGSYTCSATYASNQDIAAQVEVFVFVGIRWEDAPEEQYAVAGLEQKVHKEGYCPFHPLFLPGTLCGEGPAARQH